MKTNVYEPLKLTEIKGIGSVREQWLQEIGVHTIPELLALPTEEIENQLKSHSRNISHSDIENWQEQAQVIQATENATSSLTEKDGSPEFSEGHTIATFIVEYQKRSTSDGEQIRTLVQHMEGGELGEGKNYSWHGFADNILTDWMKGQIDEQYLILEKSDIPEEKRLQDPIRESIQEQTPESKTQKDDQEISTKPIFVTISKLQAYQPPEIPKVVGQGLSGKVFTGFIKGNQPFLLTLDLAFESLQNSTVAKKPISYQIQAYFTNRQTRKVIEVEKNEELIFTEREMKKKTQLPVITLTPGYYRLQTVVTLPAEKNARSFLEVPLLNVA